MADEDDDYLADKFLLEPASAPPVPKTYAERRKEAQRVAALKNEQNRKKTKRQLEQESREEGLSKSLFERAKDEEASGQQNKALAMMMKMGFKPGEPLGRKHDDVPPSASASARADANDVPDDRGAGPSTGTKADVNHRVEPLPLNEWAGRRGIGLGKRARSPTAAERLAKMAKLAEETDQTTFRDRVRQDYEERRAQGRLGPAQRTCATLDEKAGVKFNVLWLNSEHPESFPEGLIDALDIPELGAALHRQHTDDTIEGHLKARMKADALQPTTSLDEDGDDEQPEPELVKSAYSPEEIEEATKFLQLSAQNRLQLVLDYLRRKYAYCFWCGTQYDDFEDMENNCPGSDEDAHD